MVRVAPLPVVAHPLAWFPPSALKCTWMSGRGSPAPLTTCAVKVCRVSMARCTPFGRSVRWVGATEGALTMRCWITRCASPAPCVCRKGMKLTPEDGATATAVTFDAASPPESVHPTEKLWPSPGPVVKPEVLPQEVHVGSVPGAEVV